MVTALSDLKELSDREVADLMHKGIKEYRRRLAAQLVDVLHELVADDVVALTFGASEWDDGYLLDHNSAAAELADGSKERVEFPEGDPTERLRDCITFLGWTQGVGRDSGLHIDMRTGELEELG